MEFKNIAKIEKATRRGRNDSFRLGVGLLFAVGILLYTSLSLGVSGPHATLLVAASVIGGYMAMNIGTNDVANNVGPAVGAPVSTTHSIIGAALGPGWPPAA